MTGQEIVLDLLRYIGVTGFAAVDNDQRLNRSGLDDDDVRRAIVAINSALQSVQKYGPQDLKYGDRAVFYNDPTSLAISVIASNGMSATAPSPPPAWMLGCSILLQGDTDVNRIMDITGNDFSLLRGYRGTSSTNLTATVYADCALLSPDIQAVLPPALGTPALKLYEARDMDEFLRIRRRRWGGYGLNGVIEAVNPTPGVPVLYITERRRQGDVFLRITPMPGRNYNVSFQAKLRAERVDDSIVNTATGVDPGYEFTSLHDDEVESILLPIARWRFFTHPALKNAETRAAVKAEYDEAMITLRGGMTLETAVHDNRASYI